MAAAAAGITATGGAAAGAAAAGGATAAGVAGATAAGVAGATAAGVAGATPAAAAAAAAGGVCGPERKKEKYLIYLKLKMCMLWAQLGLSMSFVILHILLKQLLKEQEPIF